MSKLAQNLLNDIRKEYQNRLNNGESKSQVVFSQNIFIEKYNYSKNVLEKLLDELNNYGYIEKWITGDFEFIVD